MSTARVLGFIIGILILAGGFWWLKRRQLLDAPAPEQTCLCMGLSLNPRFKRLHPQFAATTGLRCRTLVRPMFAPAFGGKIPEIPLDKRGLRV
jgi:hypothetical protein